jgi:hypothetical protein
MIMMIINHVDDDDYDGDDDGDYVNFDNDYDIDC